MTKEFLEANQLDSMRKLHSLYTFRIDAESPTPEITVRIWELLGANLAPGYKFEAELSHTIQNDKQGTPYSPMPIESSPERALEIAVSTFVGMYDGPGTRIEERKEA